jgi:hypothetical protein
LHLDRGTAQAGSENTLGGVGRQRLAPAAAVGTAIALPGRVRHRARRPFVAFAILLTACGFDPAGSQPWEAPAVYREWWDKTEACSGLSGNFDRVEWMVVPGESFRCSSGNCVGHWEPGHTIFLASDWTMHEMVVRHEMLHDLMRRSGHPSPPFGSSCPLTWESWPSSQPAPVPTASAKPLD